MRSGLSGHSVSKPTCSPQVAMTSAFWKNGRTVSARERLWKRSFTIGQSAKINTSFKESFSMRHENYFFAESNTDVCRAGATARRDSLVTYMGTHRCPERSKNRIGTYLERTAPDDWNSESKFPNTYSFGEEIDRVSGAFQDSKYTSGNTCVVPARRGCWVPFKV